MFYDLHSLCVLLSNIITTNLSISTQNKAEKTRKSENTSRFKHVNIFIYSSIQMIIIIYMPIKVSFYFHVFHASNAMRHIKMERDTREIYTQ